MCTGEDCSTRIVGVRSLQGIYTMADLSKITFSVVALVAFLLYVNCFYKAWHHNSIGIDAIFFLFG